MSQSVVPFPALSLSHSFSVFSDELACHIRWPKCWSFNFGICPSSEYSGLMSFRMDWLDLLAVQGDSQEFSLTPQFKSINSLTPETAAHQAPLSLGFSRQEHWSRLPFPSPICCLGWSNRIHYCYIILSAEFKLSCLLCNHQFWA